MGVPAHCLENQLDAALRADLALVWTRNMGIAHFREHGIDAHVGLAMPAHCNPRHGQRIAIPLLQLRAAGVPANFREHGIDSHVLGISGGEGHGKSRRDRPEVAWRSLDSAQRSNLNLADARVNHFMFRLFSRGGKKEEESIDYTPGTASGSPEPLEAAYGVGGRHTPEADVEPAPQPSQLVLLQRLRVHLQAHCVCVCVFVCVCTCVLGTPNDVRALMGLMPPYTLKITIIASLSQSRMRKE